MLSIAKALIEKTIVELRTLGISVSVVVVALRAVETDLKETIAKEFKMGDVPDWIEACCNKQHSEAIAAASLYANYRKWGGGLSNLIFGRALKQYGCYPTAKADGRYWYGLELKGMSVAADIDRWIVEQCEQHPYARLTAKDLHAAYGAWSKLPPISKQRFNKALADRGFAREGYVWRGLTTKAALVCVRQQLQELQK